MATSIARLTMILVATLATSAALAAQTTYDKRLDAPPGGRLTFEADVGSVSVIGGDTHEVVVHAQLEGPQSYLHRLHIRAEQTASGVTISARMQHRGWLDWLDWLDSGSIRAQFTVSVPRNYPVELQTSGGNLDMQDLHASVRARTSGGGIRLENIAGEVSVHTSGGGIQAQRLDGPAELSTSGGSIDVANSIGDLDLRTSGGGIRIQDGDGRVDADTSGGSIRAQLRSNRGIRLETSGGGITLLLPQNSSGSLEAQASGGGVHSDFPLSSTQITDGDHLQGTIGDGGAPMYLRTSGGSIHLERSP